jgi:hypothetical protein
MAFPRQTFCKALGNVKILEGAMFNISQHLAPVFALAALVSFALVALTVIAERMLINSAW